MTDDTNLTRIERRALSASINLADGHARYALPGAAIDALAAAFERTMRAGSNGSLNIEGAEQDLLDELGRHTGVAYGRYQTSLIYSASVSLDIAAKILNVTKRSRVGMMNPTFDNLAGLFQLNGVDLVPVPDDRMYPEPDFDALDALHLDALVVVLPNNPTGGAWARATTLDALEWAARSNVLVVVDASFRLFDPAQCWDQLRAAEELGAPAILIEDTGKVLPLLDSKLSVLSASRDLAGVAEDVVDEVLLNCSSIDAILIRELLSVGQVEAARDLVRRNRLLVGRVLAELPLVSRGDVGDISVAWVDVGNARTVVEECERRGLQILPGGQFYWDHPPEEPTHVRLALMRDESVVRSGLAIFRDVLNSAPVLR